MATPPPSVALPFNVDNTLGALLIGGLFAAAFWGITSVQAYIYFQRYPDDRPALKIIVVILWVLDTFDACLTSQILYYYLVINYMNPSSIGIPVWSIIVSHPYFEKSTLIEEYRTDPYDGDMCHGCVYSVVIFIPTHLLESCLLLPSLFSKRVWGLSNGNIFLTSIVWILSLCDLIVGLVITAKAFQLASFSQLDTLTPWFYASFVTTFAGDLYVSLVLCYYLFKSKTGLRRTNTMVNTLLCYIITTGLLTSIDAILGTTMYAVMPTNYIFLAFYFNLPKLYINSYLALMNARKRLRKGDGPISIELSGLSGSSDPHLATGFTASCSEHSSPNEIHKVMATRGELEIAVHTTVDRTGDTVRQTV
ncbi:hypothetical protein JVU11DRAFT_8335 [Chiua virens]|nr:hypothetical protein JVU11DRAFT_8335 [Chiua virens]